MLEAIHRLDEMSGGPGWLGSSRGDFDRDEALAAIQLLVGAKNVKIATGAITVFGESSPYFNDQDGQFW